MGAQPSSGKAGGSASGSGPAPRSLGSVESASFVPAPEPSESPRKCTPPWARSAWQPRGLRAAGSSGDFEVGGGLNDLEEGPRSPSNCQTIRVEVDTEPAMDRRPSKMSVQSMSSEEDRAVPKPAKADSRPTSAKVDSRPSSSHEGNYSRSSSLAGSRPASASSKTSSKQGLMRPPKVPARDPELAHADKLAKLSLERLEQEVVTREGVALAWGGFTPSTASPANLSRAASSVSSSTCGSRPASSAASVCSSGLEGKDPNVKQNLKDARLRAKASSQALLAELMGSAGATPARYSTWPIGCPVRIIQDGCAGPGTDAAEELCATLVSYDKKLNTFEVKLDDGSMRTLPAHCVARARARRSNAQPPQGFVPGQMQQLQSNHGYESRGKECGISVVTDATRMDGVPGNNRGSNIPSDAMRMDAKVSSQAKHPHSQQQQMPGGPLGIEAMPSNLGEPQPHVLGRVEFLD